MFLSEGDLPMLMIALCLIVPPVWGLIAARIITALDRKRNAPLKEPSAQDMYEI